MVDQNSTLIDQLNKASSDASEGGRHYWESLFAVAASHIEALERQVKAADALADRVNTWSNDNLTDDNCRDWFGHVEPALAAYQATKEGE